MGYCRYHQRYDYQHHDYNDQDHNHKGVKPVRLGKVIGLDKLGNFNGLAGNPERVYSCLIVENEPLIVEMVRELVTSRDDLSILDVVSEMEQLARAVHETVPDIIFLDLVIPRGNCGDFHFGMLPDESSIVVISAIPLSHYKNRHLLKNPRELFKPVSLERFNSCIDAVVSERSREGHITDD